MIAMVLAAGRGERMLPLTRTLPKPAIPVLGRPIIEQVLHQLAGLGIRDVVMNLHHHADQLARVVGDGAEAGLETVRFSRESTILGTGGGIRRAAPLLRGRGTILVRNADFLSDVDLESMLRAHRATRALATLLLAPARAGYSAVEVDRDGRVLSLAGRPQADPSRVAGRHLFTGLHLIEEEVLDLIPPEGPSDIVRDVYWKLAEEGRLGSVVTSGFWWEFGAPREYLDGCLRLIEMPAEERARVARIDPVRHVGGARVAMGPGVELHPGSVEMIGRVGVGFATNLGEGVSIEDSVVMNEAWLGPGCRLKRAIVGPGMELPAGFEVEDAMVGPAPDSSEREGGLEIVPLTPRA
jgi:NDP-sugar pyrophosphorylase family protein